MNISENTGENRDFDLSPTYTSHSVNKPSKNLKVSSFEEEIDTELLKEEIEQVQLSIDNDVYTVEQADKRIDKNRERLNKLQDIINTNDTF